MGAYRSKPITDKVSSDESGKYVKCGASSMQGWRVTQEDAHNCILEFDENTSLFAVYDGHGGHEVAQYCSENLPQYLKDCASYKSKEYSKALKEAFLGFDATLIDPKVVKVLNNIVKSADDEAEGSENQNSGSEDEENIRNLYEEAQMPLEEVMAKYQTDGLNPALKKLKGGTPPSPYLVAKQSSKSKFSEEAGSSGAGSSSGGSSSSSSSSGSSSSSSTSSGGVEPVEDSSNESAEKVGDEECKEADKKTDKSQESNGDIASASHSKEPNGDKVSQECPDSNSGNTTEKVEEASCEKKPEESKDNKEGDVTKEIKSECVKEEVKALKEEPKVEKKSMDNHTKEEEKAESIVKEETKDVKQDKKKSPTKKLEVNGDVEPKDMKRVLEKEPHENGDVGEEETEDEDEKEVTKSRKGKGKAIVKKSERPKRTSARQRNMAILFRSLLSAQDSADSESDDEGDESFQGAEERSSSEDEDKEEEAEAEGEEEEEEDDEEEDDGEEEEEEEGEYEDEELPKIPKGPGVESGCTAVVALLHGRDLYVANAGDSRCIVSRDGEALDMSLDHKPEDDIEIERIVSAGGFVSSDGRVNGGLNLSRAIGDHAYKQTENLPAEEQMITALPDVRTLSIDPEKDEFMVLACDGIWNSMTSQEVVNFVRTRLQSSEEKLLSQICEELFDFCLAPDTASDGTGCDNMTAVIVQFLPILSEAKSSDLPNTSICTATNKRPASPTENSDSSAKRFKTSVV